MRLKNGIKRGDLSPYKKSNSISSFSGKFNSNQTKIKVSPPTIRILDL